MMKFAKRMMTILLAGQLLAAALCLGACCAMNMRPGDGGAMSQTVNAVVSSGHCHSTGSEEKASAPAAKKTSAGQNLQSEISLTDSSHSLCLCLVDGEGKETTALGTQPPDRRDEQLALISPENQALWLLDPSPPEPGRFSPSIIPRSPYTGFQLSLRI
jgi:hypothetical protein